jgi:hypothetical protein
MTCHTKISKLNLLRFWLYEHRMPLGLGIAFAVLGALLAALLPLTLPTGPDRLVEGTVVSVGVMSTGRSASSSVTVAVDGTQITLRTVLGERCVIGQPVDMLKRRTRLGARYLLTLHRCDPPPSRQTPR